MSTRVIGTKLYSDKAYEIISAVFGQLSDGWGENNPSNDKWWRFGSAERAPDGEVRIVVSQDYYKKDMSSLRTNFINNGFYGMSDDEVKAKIAHWIKKTMQMELRDSGIVRGWKRDNVDFTTSYLNYNETITVAVVYVVYEELLGRFCGLSKYSPEILHAAFGERRSDEETARVSEEKRKKAALRAKYDADIAVVNEWEKSEKQKIENEAVRRRAAIYDNWRASEQS